MADEETDKPTMQIRRQTVYAAGGGGLLATLAAAVATFLGNPSGELERVAADQTAKMERFAESHGDKLEEINKSIGEMAILIDRNTRLRDDFDRLENEVEGLRLEFQRALADHVGTEGHGKMMENEAVLRHQVEQIEARLIRLEEQKSD